MMDVVKTPQFGFCRDCLAVQTHAGKRCTACGSPRLALHAELFDLSIAHIDCDAFYASVEKRDNPALANLPVIIGGGKRGVVSTACYVARVYGVRSAMPMFKALEACPQAVVVRPDMAKYARVGSEVRQMMLEMTPLVEPVSIDEAFLDLSGTEKLHRLPPALTLARFAKRVQDEIGISVSVGLSYCKFLAKIASDLEKPRGFSIIGKAEVVPFLGALPVSKIWGVGKAFEETLAKDGIIMIAQLQTMEEDVLIKRYGVMGQRLFRLSRGLDNRAVDPTSDMKSISAETTFFTDISELSDLRPILRELSEKVARRLKKAEIAGKTIVLKLKTQDFKSRTRNKSMSDPTQLADRIFRTGLNLLEREIDGTKFRLIGIGVSEFMDPKLADPQDLVDPLATKRAKAETAMDTLRAKFGNQAVELGETFGKNRR